MRSRELKPAEWTNFFNGFSRRFHGSKVSVAVRDKPHGLRFLAQQLPLQGVMLEMDQKVGTPSIEVLLGESGAARITHVVRTPRRLRVGQVSNGADEVLLIRSATGATTIIDFSPNGVIRRVAGGAVSITAA